MGRRSPALEHDHRARVCASRLHRLVRRTTPTTARMPRAHGALGLVNRALRESCE